MSTPWFFRQLDGERAELRLEGHGAPHGRPYKGEVVGDGIGTRTARTYYPGNDVPTRHVFGGMHDDWILRGRFTDRRGGRGYAEARHNEVKRYQAQRRPVAIVWGSRINARGFLSHYIGRIEGPGEVAWELTIEIDEDLTLGEVRRPPTQTVTPRKRTENLVRGMDKSLRDMSAPQPPTMRGSIFDTVESLVYAVNGAAASLNAVVTQIGNLTTAPFHLLRTLKAGISTFRSAITRLRGYYDDLTVNIALESRDAREMRRFWDVQAAWGASSLEALRELAEMEREATLSQRSRTLAYYEATDGDTWERIANQFYGSPDRAGDIQSANGVEAGEPPTPGDLYLIPR